MLDLQRHMYCPIWENAIESTAESSLDASLPHWTGIKYACQKVLETYCKVFNQQELFDLIVRYFFYHYYQYFKLF